MTKNLRGRAVGFITLLLICINHAKSQTGLETIEGRIFLDGKEVINNGGSSYTKILISRLYHVKVLVEDCDEEISRYNLYKNKEDLENGNKWIHFQEDINWSFAVLDEMGKAQIGTFSEHPITATTKSGKEYYINSLKLYSGQFLSNYFTVDLDFFGEISIMDNVMNEGYALSISKKEQGITQYTLIKDEIYKIYSGSYNGKPDYISLYFNGTKICSQSATGGVFPIEYKFETEGTYAITATYPGVGEYLWTYFDVKLKLRDNILVDNFLVVSKHGQLVDNIKVPDGGLIYEVSKGMIVAFQPRMEGQLQGFQFIKDGEILRNDQSMMYIDLSDGINEDDLGTYSFYGWDYKNYMIAPNVTLVAPPKPYFDYIGIITKNGELKTTANFKYTIEENVSEQTYLVAHGTGRNPIYFWYKNGETYSVGNATINFSNIEASNGRYHCVIMDDNYEITSFFIDIKYTSSTTLPKPQIHGIHIESDNLSITVNNDYYHEISKGESIFLTINANGSNLRYQWYKNDNPLNGETYAALSIYTENLDDYSGRYTCMVIDDNYEIMSFPIDINVMATGNEDIEQSTIKITQNKKEITVHNGDGNTIYVINSMGQIVLQKELRNNMEHISLPSGVYFIRIVDKSYKVNL